MTDPDEIPGESNVVPPRAAPGGPYFGRLLIVLFAAVAFCALITWYLSTTVGN